MSKIRQWPPERLPEFIQRFRATLQKHGTDGAFYGHASVGCLHIRPLLNLKDKAEQIKMRQIMEEVTDLVLEFGGALSGEHGDGLVRSEWNRKMFGPQIYEAFRRVKGVFDPKGLLNPGKVVDAPSMNENLRYHDRYKPYEPATQFDFSKQQGFVRAIEMCNGSGVCRKQEGGAMCPSFRATMDEKDSTRGRANALRLALAGEQPLKELRSPSVRDVLDLCLMCKACKSECPSNVDMAKLKAEFLQLYYADRFRPLSHWLLAQTPRLYRWGAPLAPAVNWLQENRLFRWFMHHLAGIGTVAVCLPCTAITCATGFRGINRPRGQAGWGASCSSTIASPPTTSPILADRRCEYWNGLAIKSSSRVLSAAAERSSARVMFARPRNW